MTDWALISLVAIPLCAAIASFLFRNQASTICIVGGALQVVALGVLIQTTDAGRPITYTLAGWGAPLGIDLYIDSLSISLLLLTTSVAFAVTLYSGPYFAAVYGDHGKRISQYFWPLFMLIWAALNAVFLSGDVFNFYVTLELLTLAAVGLVGLSGKPEAVVAAIRYLFSALVASMFFLFGVAILYGHYGTLDWNLLGEGLETDIPTMAGIVLITVALLVKTALFPFHFWLPGAHSIAPAPVSALLSSVVLKASFYILYRLWNFVFPAFENLSAGHTLLALLGSAAVVWGSIQAMRQRRAKQMLAYSSIAQIGYLFLFFGVPFDGQASYGLPYFILSHGFAKSAAFLAVGALMISCGSDEIVRWKGLARKEPMLVLALSMACVSLMGLPPSGGFIAKFILLSANFDEGQYGFVVVALLGGLLAAGYVFKMLGATLRSSSKETPNTTSDLSIRLRWIPLILASIAILLGFIPSLLFDLLHLTT